MTRTVEEQRRLLRARDAVGRVCARPRDVPALDRSACVAEAPFDRTSRASFGETPARCPRRRR